MGTIESVTISKDYLIAIPKDEKTKDEKIEDQKENMTQKKTKFLKKNLWKK